MAKTSQSWKSKVERIFQDLSYDGSIFERHNLVFISKMCEIQKVSGFVCIPPVLLRLCMIVSFGMMLMHFNSSCVGCRCIAHACDRNQSTKTRAWQNSATFMYNLHHEYLNVIVLDIARKWCEIPHQIPIIHWCNKPGRKNTQVVKELSVNSQQSGSSRRSLAWSWWRMSL